MKSFKPPSHHLHPEQGAVLRTCAHGFTLLEVLVSSIVIIVATIGSIAAFNLITQSVRGTGLRADQSRRIDAQIAEISRISEIYTACRVPQGEVPATPVTVATACAGAVGTGPTAIGAVGDSFYFFPDPANAGNVNAFFTACRSTTASTHITGNFVARINNNALFPQPGGGVTRNAATRVEPGIADNHVVEVTWSDASVPPRVLRIFRISPLVTAWCP